MKMPFWSWLLPLAIGAPRKGVGHRDRTVGVDGGDLGRGPGSLGSVEHWTYDSNGGGDVHPGEPAARLELGLQSKELVLLVLTFLVASNTLVSGRTHVLPGAVQPPRATTRAVGPEISLGSISSRA
jgi:hypothetical protein